MDLGEEEMDPKTMKNPMAAMQAEMAIMRSNQDNVAETIILQQAELDMQRRELAAQQEEILRHQREAATTLEVSLHLARGAQAAPPQ